MEGDFRRVIENGEIITYNNENERVYFDEAGAIAPRAELITTTDVDRLRHELYVADNALRQISMFPKGTSYYRTKHRLKNTRDACKRKLTAAIKKEGKAAGAAGAAGAGEALPARAGEAGAAAGVSGVATTGEAGVATKAMQHINSYVVGDKPYEYKTFLIKQFNEVTIKIINNGAKRLLQTQVETVLPEELKKWTDGWSQRSDAPQTISERINQSYRCSNLQCSDMDRKDMGLEEGADMNNFCMKLGCGECNNSTCTKQKIIGPILKIAPEYETQDVSLADHQRYSKFLVWNNSFIMFVIILLLLNFI